MKRMKRMKRIADPLSGLIPFMLVATLATLLTAPFAIAQTDADIRRENQRLRAEVEQLQAQLQAARARIGQLESQIDSIYRSDLVPATAPPPVDPDAVPEADPLRSPHALFHALRDSYVEALTELSIGEPDTAQRQQYLSAIERWSSRAARQHRGTARWHAAVLDTELRNGKLQVRFQPIDPNTRAAVGLSFTHTLSTLEQRRFQRLLEQAEHRTLLIVGQLTPRIDINPHRYDPGPFNRPPLLGPFAEFNYDFNIRALHHPDDDIPQDHDREHEHERDREPERPQR